jgi:DNA-binding transcriptional LysR family regulator
MELRHLRYFVAIAEEGSFTRAAARLGIQQPPLSQQLRALEGELGLALFRRHARGVDLTAAGESFLADARSLLAAADAAARRASRVAAGHVGALTIGLATSAAGHNLAPHAIREFRRRHPAVALTFIDGNAAALTEAVQERRVHVALVRAPVAQPEGLRQESLLEEPLLMAIAAKHALAARPRASIALADLRDEAFILVRRPGAPGMYGDLVAACRRAGFDPRIAAEVGNMFVNTMLVAAGVGVSVVPASMAQTYAREVAYLPIRGAPELVAPLTLVSREEESNPPALEFIALARELAGVAEKKRGRKIRPHKAHG